MKTLVFLFFFFCCIGSAKADQLAWISKDKAEEAAAIIRKQKKVFLYCGCCSKDDVPMKLPVLSVEVKFTGYEEYYEVIVTFKDLDGKPQTAAIDLAYTWMRRKKKMITLGEAVQLEHDPCNPYPTKKV